MAVAWYTNGAEINADKRQPCPTQVGPLLYFRSFFWIRSDLCEVHCNAKPAELRKYIRK